MANKKQNVASLVRTAVEKPITDMGYMLWDVAFYKEGAELILEVLIDKKGGVSIEDCSSVTRVIDPIIDTLDPIEESYSLMVSSAGSDRVLNNTEHINIAINEKLSVIFKLFSAFEGKKEYSGKILSVDAEAILIQTDNIETKLPRKLVSRMTALFYDNI
ncbi:MAG: hypothetical protein A2Y15_00395 [Clostridiales bacterium GWF2_36_10]|nr:MAG: hypothetical protein A2Y15_00395 [Clostridiales bacterium GWF2_36_10]HAN21751.1 ribosome maturation factor RimP [Clostridiales bacterium]